MEVLREIFGSGFVILSYTCLSLGVMDLVKVDL